MEERMIDDDFGKNEDYSLDLPEGESENYNEDEVGLTPTQLAALEEERKRARLEAEKARDKSVAQGNLALKSACYEEAAEHFLAALSYDTDCVEAGKGLILARTREFSTDEPFFDINYAEEISALNDESLTFLKENAGSRLSSARERIEEELIPLEREFSASQETRREAFKKNYLYYLVRVCGLFLGAIAFLVGVYISSYFITRTQSIVPVVLTIIFGIVAFVLLIVAIPFARKLVVASRLKNENEELSSTEIGARLEQLQMQKYCLDLLLTEKTK